MDPLSVIASCIAIATLAAKTCEAFDRLRNNIKVLPGRIHALNNEVADLELVLREVATVFSERQQASLVSDKDEANIPVLLADVRAKLLKLKEIVDRLTELVVARPSPHSKLASFLNGREFTKEQPGLALLQEDIRTVKCSLNILLGASNS